MSKQFEPRQIEDATGAELRGYAATFLGIPCEGLTDGEVLSKVIAANEGETIYVRTAAAAVDQTGTPPPQVAGAEGGSTGLAGGLGRSDPKVRLTLHAEERDGVVTSHHKEVGVNGVVWLLKRGVSLEVPYRVYEALNIAERENITHDGEGNVIQQYSKNTPFNVERMPPPEEVEAWKKTVRDKVFPD